MGHIAKRYLMIFERDMTSEGISRDSVVFRVATELCILLEDKAINRYQVTYRDSDRLFRASHRGAENDRAVLALSPEQVRLVQAQPFHTRVHQHHGEG